MKPQHPVVAEIWQRGAFYGLHNMLAISKVVGIPYDRFRTCLRSPETITLEEFQKLHRTIRFDLDVVVQAAK